jgi:hypothetical protein
MLGEVEVEDLPTIVTNHEEAVQSEIVRSEPSKPNITNSPGMRGAPQVGFSVTVRRMRFWTFFEIRFLPIIRWALEITRQYRAGPALCHRTTGFSAHDDGSLFPAGLDPPR